VQGEATERERMRTRGLVFLLAGIFAGLAGCGGSTQTPALTNPDPPPPTDSVSGTVTFNGTPLAGATVTAFDTNNNSVYGVATTDSSGKYSFSGIGTTGNVAGEYQFWASKPGYGFYPSTGSGAKVTRADYTGQFSGNGVTDIAIYFTVIDYAALPEGPLTGANFTAYDGTAPLVRLAATGQQISYAAGDDAAQHQGIAWPASRFSDNGDGTVRDNLTGLVWLADAGCLQPAPWAAAIGEVNQLASGMCGLKDGSASGDWRLPNLNELESVVDVSASNPAITPGAPFVHVSSGIYWSSTSYWGGEGGSPNAWAIRLGDGRYINDGVANSKTGAGNAVWAVRGSGSGAVAALQATGMYVPYTSGDDGSLQTGIPLTYPRWIDNGNGTITDTMTGLIWLKKADCIQQPWSGALAAVQTLASGQCGLSDNSAAGDWRMPNRNEMQSLSDRMETNHADFFNATYVWKDGTPYRLPLFTNFIAAQYYWTSTTDAADSSEAWTVFSCDFGVYDTPKNLSGYTLAVR